MKDLTYTFIDKSEWPRGEWDSEPDKMQFTTAAGLPALIVRGPVGALCGYVGVDEKHTLHGVSYSEDSSVLGEAFDRRMEQPIGEHPAFGVMIAAALGGELKRSPEAVFIVHGGLTFSDFGHPGAEENGICHIPDISAGEPERVWWFGFDCSHCDDLAPEMYRYSAYRAYGTYRNVAYVREQVESLASQLAWAR